MADFAKAGSPSISTIGPTPGSNKLPTLYAGEAIAAGDACYIKQADGKVYRSLASGAAGAENGKVHGYAPMDCPSGEAITLFFNCTFRYGSGLTPGKPIFLSANAGAIADTAVLNFGNPLGFIVDATRVYLRQSTHA